MQNGPKEFPEAPRPVVVVSRCLAHEACRWDGSRVNDRTVRRMEDHVTFVTVCPEVGIGLGVPRRPVRMVAAGEKTALVQPATGRDCTEAMEGFIREFIGGLGEVDGFLLKSRSPSCGPDPVRVYKGPEDHGVARKGPGLLGGAVRERFPQLPVEDEGRLHNFILREHFLTRLFVQARFRAVKSSGKMGGLVEFHGRHKYLFMGYNQAGLRILGRIVANPKKMPVAEVFAAYASALPKALSKAPRYTSLINALQHAYGHVSRGLGPGERAYFLDVVEEYRRGGLPMTVPLGILKGWALRFEDEYLLKQVLLEPYPQTLVSITDSGKGRKM